MPTARRKLRIDEVSLVANPANPGALVALFKTKEERMTKTDIYEAMKKAAEAVRQEGETPEQALARYALTPEGREDYVRYRAAKAPPAPPPAVRAAAPGSAALRSLEKAADALRAAAPELTREAAIARAAQERPDLYRQYRAEVAAP